MPVTIELQPLETQTALNLKRWSEILDDPELARLPHRIETDRHGHIVMTLPPAPFHGQKQSFISSVLQRLLPQGTVITECPVSTSDGVKAIDVAWLDAPRRQEMPFALSAHRKFASTNTTAEIREKKALYFEAGVREVWICHQDGTIDFFYHGTSDTCSRSEICPDFPSKIDL